MPGALLPTEATPDFRKLLDVYEGAKIEFPQLKLVSFAQWTLECGWGSTKLAREHHNYGGAKWRAYMKPWSTPVLYTPHAGDAEGTINYCKFKTHEEWIAGYWGRFDVESAYKGWRNHVKTGDDFIRFIGPIWVGTGPAGEAEYVRHVFKLKTMLAHVVRDTPNASHAPVHVQTPVRPVDGRPPADGHPDLWDGLRQYFPKDGGDKG